MKVLRLLIITALLVMSIGSLMIRPEPVEAQGLWPPNVITIDAWLHTTSTQLVYVEVWGRPGTFYWPFGYCEMFAQYREPGGEWQDSTRLFLTSLQYTKHIFMYFASGRDMTVEVRGALYYHGNLGIEEGYLYGTTFEVYIPAVDTTPYVFTGQLWRLSSTSLQARAYGDPAGEGSGDLYIQYRQVGTSPWSDTTKETITGYAYHDWEITGLGADTAYEVRAALDYDATTIYGDIVQIYDPPDGEGEECETQPSGSGTELDPYIITDVCELNWMRNDLDGYYELGNDIDASSTVYWHWSESKLAYEGWEPVGEGAGTEFEGSFDGQGYTISGLYVNREDHGTEYASLLGRVVDAQLLDFTLLKPVVMGDLTVGAVLGQSTGASAETTEVHVVDGYVSGRSRVGGFAGKINSAVNYCSYEGEVAQKQLAGTNGYYIGGFAGVIHSGDADIYRCFSDATITSESIYRYIGGFVGHCYYYADVQECYALGSLSAVWSSSAGRYGAGGFAGYGTHMRIKNCYSRVSVTATNRDASSIGGFAGYQGASYSNMDDCYSTGSVTVHASSTSVGGFLGSLSDGTVTNCFWDTQTSGQATSAGGTGKTTPQMKTSTTFTDAGWNFVDIWDIDSEINDGYPYLSGVNYVLTVTTQAGTDIDATSFTAHGTITEADPNNAYARGFVYMEGTTGDPTLSDDWVSETGSYGTGTFSRDIDSLTPGTYYRVRAWATSDEVFAYGNTVTVMTSTGPTAVTLDAEQMAWQAWKERRLHGYIDNDGGLDCDVRFLYGLDPLDLNLSTAWRDSYPGVCPARGYQTGDYFHADILLAAGELGQTWYFRAQAQNDDGLSSGEILSFTLGDEAPEEGLSVVTYDATEKTGVSFLAHGALLVADPEAFRRGFCYIEAGYGEPDVDDDVVEEGGSFAAGAFSLYIDGLTGGEDYRVRAFAENDDGIAYGNTLTVTALGAPVVTTLTPTDIAETSFRARGEVVETGDTVTRRGFCYMVGNSGTPTLTDDVVDEYGLWAAATYNLVATGLTGGTYYRVRAFATNDIGTGYGGTITVRTYGGPDVTTNAATHIGISTARLHGEIADDGGADCQWRFQWGDATGVYTEDTAWTGALSSGEAFHSDVTELQADTVYYFRAQARNAVGLANGAELSFNTTDGIGDPSNLLATPISGTEIALTWLMGGGTDNTQIQMQQTSYPATPLHGETVYFGNESATTVEDLTPGTTYYFRAWGEGAGSYSDNYTEDMATTLAGDPDDGWDDPEEPDEWFQDPDHEGLENLPLYEQVNELFDSYGLPNTTGWVIFALLLAAIIGMLALVLSNGNLWIAMAAGGAVLVATTWIGLLTWWILLIYLACVGGFAFIRSRV